MKPEQLISAGFAISALASASVPAVGWTLLGEVLDPPTVTVQAPAASAHLFLADATLPPVAVERALPETSIQAVDRSTPW